MKEAIIELKFTNGESEEQVSTWAKGHDVFLKEADERALAIRQQVGKMEEDTGAPNDSFLPNALKICFRLSGVLLKVCICFLSATIKFLSVRSS